MANRFQLYIERKTVHQSYYQPNNGSYLVWQVTEFDHNLVEWLKSHVGEAHTFEYRIPMYGNGWKICECHGEDDDMDDFSWRRLNPYTPKGKYGFWLSIDDDEKAVLLVMSGLLDGRPRGPKWYPESLDYEPSGSCPEVLKY